MDSVVKYNDQMVNFGWTFYVKKLKRNKGASGTTGSRVQAILSLFADRKPVVLPFCYAAVEVDDCISLFNQHTGRFS